MKNKIKKSNNTVVEKASKTFVALALVIFAVFGVVVLARTFAAPGGKPGNSGGGASGPSLYLTPSSQKVAVGDTVSAQVWLNTAGRTVNTVQADINYDARYWEFVSIDNTGSAFDIEAQSTGSGGSIVIARGNLDTVTGQNLVATIRLRATAKARNTKINVANTSLSLDSATQQNILTTFTGATYVIR